MKTLHVGKKEKTNPRFHSDTFYSLSSSSRDNSHSVSRYAVHLTCVNMPFINEIAKKRVMRQAMDRRASELARGRVDTEPTPRRVLAMRKRSQIATKTSFAPFPTTCYATIFLPSQRKRMFCFNFESPFFFSSCHSLLVRLR
jgi:hypothetical protein